MMHISDPKLSVRFLNVNDFELLASIACSRLDAAQAIAICEVMEHYMLRRPCQYRNLADRIFVQLMSGHILDAHQVQVFLKQHIVTSVNELVEAEHELEMHSHKREDAEIQMQVRYICNHIAGLARGTKTPTEDLFYDHILQTMKTALMRSKGNALSNLFLSFGENFEPIRTYPQSRKLSPNMTILE